MEPSNACKLDNLLDHPHSVGWSASFGMIHTRHLVAALTAALYFLQPRGLSRSGRTPCLLQPIANLQLAKVPLGSTLTRTAWKCQS